MDDVNSIFNQPLTTRTVPRWERKKRQAEAAAEHDAAETAKTPGGADRFIPRRQDTCADLQMHLTYNENADPDDEGADSDTEMADAQKQHLAKSLFNGETLDSKVLSFKAKAPQPTAAHQNKMRVLYSQNRAAGGEAKRKSVRHISSVPERVLDAPNVVDDYYLNLCDWSCDDVVAVALGPTVYLWNAESGDIQQLLELDESSYVTSVKWMQDGSHLAVATTDNDVQMWNIERQKRVRMLRGHQARVAALAWNEFVLSSGSRDSCIFHHDVRVREHHIATLRGHEQEICGLSWSPDGKQLASGGNDNLVFIWDRASTSEPRHSFTEHNAAVKALAWSPHQRNLLATGAGTADRHIRFYNTGTGALLNAIDTDSQVCSLLWSPHSRELLSGHGFSENQLSVWSYPKMNKLADLCGHSSRVLQCSLSPDGKTVLSMGADETLRFWNVWEPASSKGKRGRHGRGSSKGSNVLDRNIR